MAPATSGSLSVSGPAAGPRMRSALAGLVLKLILGAFKIRLKVESKSEPAERAHDASGLTCQWRLRESAAPNPNPR